MKLNHEEQTMNQILTDEKPKFWRIATLLDAPSYYQWRGQIELILTF